MMMIQDDDDNDDEIPNNNLAIYLQCKSTGTLFSFPAKALNDMVSSIRGVADLGTSWSGQAV